MRAATALATSVLLLAAAGVGGCGGGDQRGSMPLGDEFYGVIPAEPLPGSDEVERLGEANVGTLRVNLAWGSVQPGPDAEYDWSHYDGLVHDAAENGIRVLATVFSTPTWIASTPEEPPLGPALPAFQAFVKAAVERYGTDGTFWKENADLPKLPITDWQLWNEQNSPLFWKPAVDATQYVSLLRAFSQAVKGVNPGARILLGGLFPEPKGGTAAQSYLAEISQAGGGDLYDAAAIHPYAANPQEAIRKVEQVRAALDLLGEAEKPIWITELGWADGGEPSGVTVDGPQQQAQYLTQAFRLAAENRNRLKIAGVVWYSLNDTPGPAWPGHCGLFNLDGGAKPSWDAFVAVTGGNG